MAGGADDCLASEQGAGGGQRAVALAQVQADAQARGQLGVVVDDQFGAVARAEFGQGRGFAQATGLVIGLVAVLQQACAALQRRFHIGQQATIGQQLAVGDGIEAAQRATHEQKSSGRRRGTNWPWPGCSASRRVRQV